MNNNLIGSIELNLINVYLGRHGGFGADEANYKQSDYFIPSIACQNDYVFNELWYNENIDIVNKLSIDLNELQDDFNKWGLNKKDFNIVRKLKGIYEIHVASLIQFVPILHRNGKVKYVDDLIKQYFEILDIFKKNKFIKHLDKNEFLGNPNWNKWEDYLYFLIVINKNKTVKLFDNLIRGNYKNIKEEDKYSYREEGKEKLVKSFLRICLNYRVQDLNVLIKDFDEYEFICLLDIIRRFEYLPIFINNPEMQCIIKAKIIELKININKSNSFILLFKKLLSIKLKKADLKFAEEEFKILKNTDSHDYHRLDIPINYAAMSYVLTKNTFEYFLRKQAGYDFRYYFGLGLYSALYTEFIALLKNNRGIESVIGSYSRYLNFYTAGTYNSKYLNNDISSIVSFIFSNSNSDISVLFDQKKVLLTAPTNFSYYHFCLQLFSNNPVLFSYLFNESDLKVYENELDKWVDDYQSYVDRYFQLASFYSNINPSKAIDLIAKGINDGILRHGWRKDYIVSYMLVEALSLLWKNAWESKEKLKEYSNDVFLLTLKVTDITDGKETWKGPYNLIELIIKYDIDFAYELKDKLVSHDGERNYWISLTTSFLLEKIKLGIPLIDIEEEMKEYRKDYDYQGKPRSDYYEEKFKVFLSISLSDLYFDEDKQIAFEKAYKIVESIIEQKIDYFLLNEEEYKEIFSTMCEKYGKSNLLSDLKSSNNVTINNDEKIKETKDKFIPQINKAKTILDITVIYEELSNYKYGRILAENNHWFILISKTSQICGNISLFLKLLEKDGFPHSSHYTSNSHYYHFGLAAALENVNTRKETIEYLSKSSGYEGFINIMKAYEVNKDQEMCRKLFDRFLKFCHLLVD